MRKAWMICLVVMVAALAYWHTRSRSLLACREGGQIHRYASRPLPWLEAANEDRFLRPLLRQGPAALAIRELRIRAALAAGEAWSWHLSPDFKTALRSLVVVDPTEKRFLESLRSFAMLPAPESCGKEEDAALARAFSEGEAYWRSRQNEVRVARLSFAHDREIFCQSEALVARLKAVLATTESKCAKSRKGCSASATAPVKQEIADIEAQREFNREKLARKWPAEILEELRCS